jgi:hypothetical protein
MTAAFQYRGYNIDCTPCVLGGGTFGARAMLTKFGYHSEKTFDALPTFATTKEAITHAKQFAEAWLEQKA